MKHFFLANSMSGSLSLDALNLASNKESDRRTRFFIPSHVAGADGSVTTSKLTSSITDSAIAPPKTILEKSTTVPVPAPTSSSSVSSSSAPKAVVATSHMIGDVHNVVIASVDARGFGTFMIFISVKKCKRFTLDAGTTTFVSRSALMHDFAAVPPADADEEGKPCCL